MEAGSQASGKASAGRRWAAGALFVVLAFACAVAIGVMVEIGENPTCGDVLSGEAELGPDLECFDGSSLAKTLTLILGWPAGVLFGIAALLSLGYAVRGRGGGHILRPSVAAIGLFILSIVVGSV